jgi:hypothetical protein
MHLGLLHLPAVQQRRSRRALRLTGGGKPVPTIGRCPTWRTSYIAKLLNWEAVLGKMRDGTGAVHDLYPAAVCEQEFYRARRALEGRRVGTGGVGRPSKGGTVNLFSGLLKDARGGSPLYLIDRGKADGTHYFLAPAAALRHAPGAVKVVFPYSCFEAAVLSLLREVKVSEVLGQKEGPDEVLVLTGKLEDAERNVAAVNAALDEHGESPEMLARLAKRTAERDQVAEDLTAAQARAAHPLSDSWSETRSLLDVAAGEDNRRRLRAALRRVVEEARVLVVHRGRNTRLAAVQFRFVSGKSPRSWLIWSRTHCGSGKHRRAARWWARSFAATPLPGDLDLRQRAHAVKLEAALLTLPWPPADG